MPALTWVAISAMPGSTSGGKPRSASGNQKIEEGGVGGCDGVGIGFGGRRLGVRRLELGRGNGCGERDEELSPG
ncbi:MAG: hypothetical protein R2845_09045 [Thermomicrobiales bacterium]